MIKETKISDIFDSIRNGYSVKQSDNATGVPITRIETISNRTIDQTKFGYANISENNLGKAKDFLLEDGDILMTHINSISHLGKSALYVEKPKMLIHGMNLLCLRAKRDIASPKYLLYWFNSPIFKTRLIKYINPAVNQASVSTTNLKKLTIPLPPLPVQQKIAAILDAADLHRRKTKSLIEKYDQLTQSIFLEMFGNPVKNEKGWERKSLLEISNKITDGTHFTPKYTESGIPFLRVTDITESNQSKKFISEAEHKELIKRCNPEKGDILYTKNGTIGVGKIVDWDYEFSIFVSLCLIKPKHEIVNAIFLNTFLNSPFALRQAMKHSKKGTITNLHLVEIKKIIISVV